MGSNPIARSIKCWLKIEDCGWNMAIAGLQNDQLFYLATWPSGKAEVCKTFIMGSNPIDASEKRRGLPPSFLV